MNFVYVCRDGKNEELRYSIRSVVRSFPDAEIWVVGGKPDWYTGNHIAVEQKYGKYENVRRNLAALYDSEEMPEDIVLMNDDFFIIQKIDSIPIYHNGPLIETLKNFADAKVRSVYTKKLLRTYRYLRRANYGHHILSYELHVPMPVKRSIMKNYKDLGLASRTIYGNMNRLGGEKMEDVKFFTAERMQHINYDISDPKHPFLSCNDKSFEIIYSQILKDMFPKPSKYEKESRTNIKNSFIQA